MDRVKAYSWVGGTVDVFPAESGGGFKVRITYDGIPMPKPNVIEEVHATDKFESIEVKVDSLDAVEDECKKTIRQKENLPDYIDPQGWRETV